jgi:hypothetical protein
MRKERELIVRMLMVSCILMIMSGCVSSKTSNSNGVKTQSYGDDGYLGRTNSYPRIPGHHMASTYNADNDLMKQAIKNLPGVNGSNVTFNGAEAYVTIKLTPGLQAREIPTVERQAASVLRFNFPRYSIHVRSMK